MRRAHSGVEVPNVNMVSGDMKRTCKPTVRDLAPTCSFSSGDCRLLLIGCMIPKQYAHTRTGRMLKLQN